jgi:plasmid maintenance system antidote protein VapI
MKVPTASTHPFGELITRYRQRRPGLTQRGLAELAGYDPALLARMCQGKRDLTGPSGRERVLRLIETLSGLRLLTSLQQANELLLAAQMPPLFEQHPAEAKLVALLAPSIGAPRIRRTNLPAALTSFVGRTAELAQVRGLLGQGRLVTLIGAGGSGKTRLAQRAGADVLIDYEDGVWYAELASQASGLYLAEVFARAVGAPSAESAALEALTEHLANKRLLLVVDNCEHIVEHVAELVGTLLRYQP